jgi:feruloyl-CoA synthase
MATAVRSDTSATPRLRPVRLGPRDTIVERRPDGAITMRSPHALGPYAEKLTDRLVHWAETTPDRIFLAQRNDDGGWRTITYAQTLDRVRRLASALLRRGLSAERPIAVLSGNDIEHGLIELAAMYIGVPYVPISPAYSLISTDFGKLRHIVDLITPGLIYATDGNPFGRAIDAVAPSGVEIVVARHPLASRPTTMLSEIDETPGTAVEAAYAAVGPDTIAKILFTSGSTGMPKGVINTQRMWCANQVMIRTALAFMQDEPPVLVDWAPWHHTAGGNHNFGLVLYNGGSFYIDEGKPIPGAIEATVRNLGEVGPTFYFNVPKGYEALLPYLRADRKLCERFFSRLKVLFYAGAGVSKPVLDEMQQLAEASCGERILFLTSLGTTETGPFALIRTWDSENPANVGVPCVGLGLKLAPVDGKYEGRLKGHNITPGYWREPELTRKAFDEEGYYRLGDAFTLVDPNDPAQGVMFDGRIAEDFKLSTGTWVSVGPMRARIIDHFNPLVRDVVLAGPDREHLTALAFPDLDACRRLASDLAATASVADVTAHPDVRAAFATRLAALARTATGTSSRVTRMLLLEEPPSIDIGEVTDKGSINQRAVLNHRIALVAELYAEPCSARVIRIDGGGT